MRKFNPGIAEGPRQWINQVASRGGAEAGIRGQLLPSCLVLSTRFYHCVGGSIRRAFWCARMWSSVARSRSVIKRCAYALLRNHSHLMVTIDAERTRDVEAEPTQSRKIEC